MRDRHQLDLAWLIRLRFWALAGQAITIVLVDVGLGVALPRAALGGILAFELLSNLLLASWAARRTRSAHGVTAAVIAADVVCLTAILSLTGGPSNPFSFLYLVYIALAAVVLRPAFTWGLVGLSTVSFAALFTLDEGAGHQMHMRMHFEGMWVAFAIGAVFIVYFVSRVTESRDALQQQLDAARAEAERAARLASLATLAAGAAHELSTPLSTIATAARELERGLASAAPDLASAAEDAHLIRGEVTRCRSILEQMAVDAGAASGDTSRPVLTRTLIEASLDGLADASRVRLSPAPGAEASEARVPLRPVAQSLRALVKNALDAAPAGDSVLVSWHVEGALIELLVEDGGPGMAAEVLARAGEPFFTTKPPGRGMGLGLFVTRTVVERLGGRLVLESTPGHGTRARLSLPLAGAVS